jgi:magnesium-transporting ATPase (P-type)
VNDAPALKQADIGVAMGSGTDVAKESAAMVLMDDNFASIVQAVRQGRVILHNLQHILLYILATSMGGLLTLAVSVAVGLPLPLLPAQLLWVNLVTDGTSTIPLAFEKEHGNVMLFPPRRKDAPLVSKEILIRICFAGFVMMVGTLGVYLFYINGILGLDIPMIKSDPECMSIYAKAQTMAFCILAFFQIWNTQNSRSIDRSILFNLPFKTKEGERVKLDAVGATRNRVLLGIMLLAIALQVSAVTIPAMNSVFDTVPLSFQEWSIVLSVSFSIIIIIEAVKYFKAAIQAKGAKIA